MPICCRARFSDLKRRNSVCPARSHLCRDGRRAVSWWQLVMDGLWMTPRGQWCNRKQSARSRVTAQLRRAMGSNAACIPCARTSWHDVAQGQPPLLGRIVGQHLRLRSTTGSRFTGDDCDSTDICQGQPSSRSARRSTVTGYRPKVEPPIFTGAALQRVGQAHTSSRPHLGPRGQRPQQEGVLVAQRQLQVAHQQPVQQHPGRHLARALRHIVVTAAGLPGAKQCLRATGVEGWGQSSRPCPAWFRDLVW